MGLKAFAPRGAPPPACAAKRADSVFGAKRIGVADAITYLESVHPPIHALLLELEQHARKDGVPLVSRDTGRLLSTLVHAMQANRILEIGTGYGYATLWMAFAQPPMGKIWTLDTDVERTEVALSYFQRSGEGDFITLFNQSALELLPNFGHRNLDIVFLDARKSEYVEYLDLVVPMLKRSGLIVVDDCLLDNVAEAPTSGDSEDVLAIRTFNERFLNHPDLDATILALGNGIGIGARIR